MKTGREHWRHLPALGTDPITTRRGSQEGGGGGVAGRVPRWDRAMAGVRVLSSSGGLPALFKNTKPLLNGGSGARLGMKLLDQVLQLFFKWSEFFGESRLLLAAVIKNSHIIIRHKELDTLRAFATR